jgi:hypothetical protein
MKKIYKGGSYMKRIISLILMCVMLLCIVSCKRRPQDDVRADIPAQSSGDAADEPEDKTDKEKTEDKPAENADDNKNDINTENKKNTETTEQKYKDNVEDANNNSENTEKEETETDAPADDSKPTTGPESWVISTEEKAPPCSVTIDNDFEEGKVLVYLTRAQSAARQEYTAEDFPGLDIEKITVGPYFPESNDQIFISLVLTQKDKASVIEAIRILEQNPIVYCASPNLIYKVIYP